jgi:ectoine hydroxylase-related dioxygenase (phytanoyl-CoA dioxygenase family)
MTKIISKDFFFKNGFSYHKKVINQKKIDIFYKSFISSLSKDNKNYEYLNKASFESHSLTKEIQFLNKINSNLITFIYKNIVHYSSFINLFENYKIRKEASRLLKTRPENLIIAEHQFRIDYPNDKRHILNWHQDANFYPQDPDGKNSLVCNISLHNVKKNMGSTILLPGSQNLGLLKFKKKQGNKKYSGQRTVADCDLSNFKEMTLNTYSGDISFYDTKLIHKSGFNSSNKVRFSAIARIFNPMNKNYISFEKSTKKIIF